jgi:hypothetical protein
VTTLRAFLVMAVVALGGYTLMVGARHGWSLLPIFFADIGALNWPGQFNLDFLLMLALSALWVAWRHRFSAAGLLLAIAALFGGTMFLAPYLLYASWRVNGDAKALLIGEARAAG